MQGKFWEVKFNGGFINMIHTKWLSVAIKIRRISWSCDMIVSDHLYHSKKTVRAMDSTNATCHTVFVSKRWCIIYNRAVSAYICYIWRRPKLVLRRNVFDLCELRIQNLGCIFSWLQRMMDTDKLMLYVRTWSPIKYPICCPLDHYFSPSSICCQCTYGHLNCLGITLRQYGGAFLWAS